MVLLGAATLPGSRYGALNQDYVLVDALHSDADLRRLGLPQCYVALVMDGHGMLGEMAAKDAAAAILQSLKASVLKTRALGALPPREVEAILVEAFHVGHDAAMQKYETAPRNYTYPKHAPEERKYTLTSHMGQAVYSHPLTGARLLEFGTTATAVVVQGRCLAVAHAGDSLVVVGREGNDPSEPAKYTGEVVTAGHSGSHEGERERLAQHGGKKPKIRKEDGYITVPVPGLPSGLFSLAMTRALGHRMMAAYGVIPTPEVALRRLGPKDVCIIAASDGVWEGVDANRAVREVCDAMADGRGASGAAAALCKQAVAVVQGSGRYSRPDNTSAAVIIFDEVLEGSDGEEAAPAAVAVVGRTGGRMGSKINNE